jgi:hypothetical protein
MKQVLWLLLTLAMSACAPADPPDRGPQEITGACQRAFRPTLEAWELELGRVPSDCAFLDSTYSVELFSAAGLPCDDPGPGEVVTGCTEQPTMAIYLLDGRTNVELVDTSVHEWIHALADCVDGDMDRDHLRSELWDELSGAESVEIQAQASAEIGECL